MSRQGPKLKRSRSQLDVERYRRGYPGQKDDLNLTENKDFYFNEVPCKPDGNFIDKIHNEWFGKYKMLEYHHGYIQWLFPIREKGMNWLSQPLQLHEARAICADAKAHERVIKSYELMLDFYGMKLVDRETGALARTARFKKRYANLSDSAHNWLRVTRILKCLGEMNLEHYKKPFLLHIAKEMFEGYLRACLRSLSMYWLPVLKNKQDREEVKEYIKRIASEEKKNNQKKRARPVSDDDSEEFEDEFSDGKEKESKTVEEKFNAVDLETNPSGVLELAQSCEHVEENIQQLDAKEVKNMEMKCQRCGYDKEYNLWVDMASHQVFCGRDASGCMIEETQQTGHCIAMCLGDLSFWCYKCDKFLDHLKIKSVYSAYAVWHLHKFDEPVPTSFQGGPMVEDRDPPLGDQHHAGHPQTEESSWEENGNI